ncbi:MAG: hypothetical protein RR047_00415 [Bacilli bacterium]
MRIGIDIDGVLTDIAKYEIDLGTKYFCNQQVSIVDSKAYFTKDMFNITKEMDNQFWASIIYDYIESEPPRKFASEIIKKLKNLGHEIYLITARSSELNMSQEEIQSLTLTWLKENDIYYDKIIFSPEDKLEVCLDNKIDLMIEDKPENIKDISSKIPVIVFDSNYNETCLGPNIIRCYSWYDIYIKIITM